MTDDDAHDLVLDPCADPAALAAHLAACDRCRDVAGALRAAGDALPALADDRAPAGLRARVLAALSAPMTLARNSDGGPMTPTTDDDPTTDPDAPATESLAPKLIAVAATAVLALVFAVLAVGRAVAPPPPPPPPPRPSIDYPAMVSQAKALCESARRRVDAAREQKAAGDRDGALRSFHEAMALLDQAQALYERVSNAFPGGEYDYVGREIDRLMLERATYRKMMGELDR